MYRIDLLNGVDDMTPLDSLFPPTITVRGWSKRINAPGKLVFTMNRNNPAASDENLRMWRPVVFYRKPRNGSATMLSAWCGYIIAKKEAGERVEVLCAGALKILEKRETDADANFTGQGSTEALGLLTATNSDGETGITTGDGGVTTTMDVTLDNVTLLSALEEFAAATVGEFEVNDDFELDFVPSLGSDKSATIELIFKRDGSPGGNVVEFEIAEDGEPMANRIIGTSSGGGGLTSTYDHPTSTDDYPLLVERKSFNHANDQTTLDALTEAYGLQRGLPIPDFVSIPATAAKKFNPLTGVRTVTGLQYEDVRVGDLVLVSIVTGSRNTSVVKRIAELTVDVDEQLNERLRFTFTESGVFVTGRYLDDAAYTDIKRRLQQIEQQL